MRRFKKVIALMLALASVSTQVMAVEFGEIELAATNGIVHFEYDSRPITINDRVFIPIKYVSEMFNALTSFDTTTNTLRIRTVGGGTAEFTVDSNLYKCNGIEKEMDVEAISIEGNIYLPFRYALEALGHKIGWSNANSMAYVDGESNSIQDYRCYAYGFNGDTKLGNLVFRTKYDCGLQVLPGTQTKGMGNSLLEIYYNPSMDLDSEYEHIVNTILEGQKLIVVEDVLECLNSGVSKTVDELQYKYKETPSGIKILKIVSDTVKTDIQGTKVTNNGSEINFERIGAITRVIDGSNKVYVPLVETAKLLGKTTDNLWSDKVIFSSGEEVVVTKDRNTYVTHGITYVELTEFNNMFKSDIKSVEVQN